MYISKLNACDFCFNYMKVSYSFDICIHYFFPRVTVKLQLFRNELEVNDSKSQMLKLMFL